MTTITLIAPAPFQQFRTQSGRTYLADASGIIAGVNLGTDVLDLLAGGCVESAGSNASVPTVSVNASTVQMTSTYLEIANNPAQATSVIIPASPVAGIPYTVKDGGLNCSGGNITLVGTIDGTTNPVLNQDGVSRSFIWNGSAYRFI